MWGNIFGSLLPLIFPKQFFSEQFKEGKHGAKILCLDMLIEHARTNVTKRSFAIMEDESLVSSSDDNDDDFDDY